MNICIYIFIYRSVDFLTYFLYFYFLYPALYEEELLMNMLQVFLLLVLLLGYDPAFGKQEVAEGIPKVVMSQIIHRHGARSPLVTENETQVCGSPQLCGRLNDYGEEMMYAIGQYVRKRYNNPEVVNKPFFSKAYSPATVYARSTDMERTVKSSASFLAGVFSSSPFYPEIYKFNMTIDFLLNTDPIPPVTLKRNFDNEVLAQILNPAVDAMFSFSELQEMAAEAYSDGVCSKFEKRWKCAMELYDIGISYKMQKKLIDKPKLSSGILKLNKITAYYYEYVMSFDSSKELHRKQGAMAQHLLQTALGNMHAHILQPSYKLFEYSTHDSMMAPLGVALGDERLETFMPPYGASYIIELLENENNEFFVRVLSGFPEMDESSGFYRFNNTSFQQKCVNADGKTYTAPNMMCPFNDFIRFIELSYPAVVDGYCYVDQESYKRMGCPKTVESNAYMPPQCEMYRMACPTMSCPAGYEVNATDKFQCYPVPAGRTPSSTCSTIPPGTYILDATSGWKLQSVVSPSSPHQPYLIKPMSSVPFRLTNNNWRGLDALINEFTTDSRCFH